MMTRWNQIAGRMALVAAAIAVIHCGEEDGLEIPAGCNPLAADWNCLLPYPSDYFVTPDTNMASGRRVALTDASMLVAYQSPNVANRVDFTRLHPADGFSLQAQAIALFPYDVDDSNLVFHTGNVDVSLTPASPTLLLEADTNTPILHFAELDPRASDPAQRTLSIRPLVGLKPNTRYVVGIHGLKAHNGSSIPAPAGFALLRDGKAGGHDVLANLVAHFDNQVFSVLETAGVARGDLQLAWDFTTGTTENVTSDMVTVIRSGLATLDAGAPAVTIGEEDVINYTRDEDANIGRRINGTFKAPLFLENANAGAALYRDAEGRVTQNGMVDVPFVVVIPHSVLEAPNATARLVQYGHGFFYGRREAAEGFPPRFAEQTKSVLIAVDWWGMAGNDRVIAIQDILGDLNNTLRFTDRLHQAMLNQILAGYVAQHVLPYLAPLQISNDDDTPLYDTDHLYFYGISQGHILGGTLHALSPYLDRVVLSVGGASMPMMMMRSIKFLEFLNLVSSRLRDDPVAVQIFTALSQTTFDRIDPSVYARHVFSDPLIAPDAPPPSRHVLMQMGIGDTSIPNLATHLHARLLGIPLLQPSSRTIPGLDTIDASTTAVDGSALVEVDFEIDAPRPGDFAIPPTEANCVHSAVRNLELGIQQVDAFLKPGGKIHYQPLAGSCTDP